MNGSLPILPEYRTLIGLLRCAIKRNPPEGDLLTTADWTTTLRLARQHGVDTYLYPWLAEHAPALFSAHADVSPDSGFAAWRALFLEAIPRTLLRQRQLTEILDSFARAHIDVIPLKGAWLSETVYDDPAQRSMSDIDLLVREADCAPCHACFLSLGYTTRSDARLNPYARDQPYYHSAYPCFVELHWNVASAAEHLLEQPDLVTVWQSASATSFLGHTVRTLSNEDLLAYLAQHLLHHQFATPLRGYVDIALVLSSLGDRLSPDAIIGAASRWQLGRAIHFITGFVAHLFDIPLPPACELRKGAATSMPAFSTLAHVLFRLPPSDLIAGEQTLLQFQNATWLDRLMLLTHRVFMPQSYLSLRYACARHRLGIPLAWALRAKDLWKSLRNRSRALSDHGLSGDGTLSDFKTRESLVRQLLSEKEKSG